MYNGPVVGTFVIYSDFVNYKSGESNIDFNKISTLRCDNSSFSCIKLSQGSVVTENSGDNITLIPAMFPIMLEKAAEVLKCTSTFYEAIEYVWRI